MNTGPKYVQVLYVGGIIICLSVAEWNNKREFLLGLYLQMGLFNCQLMHREKKIERKKNLKRFIQCDFKHSWIGARTARFEKYQAGTKAGYPWNLMWSLWRLPTGPHTSPPSLWCQRQLGEQGGEQGSQKTSRRKQGFRKSFCGIDQQRGDDVY